MQAKYAVEKSRNGESSRVAAIHINFPCGKNYTHSKNEAESVAYSQRMTGDVDYKYKVVKL